ncbi:MAG: branched-chain amino acid ABC transporter permease [Acidimicrobiales bacterium]
MSLRAEEALEEPVGVVPLAPTQDRNRRMLGKGSVGVAAVLLVLLPLVLTNPTITGIGVWALLFMACATAWGGFAGLSGYVSLGYAAFYGTGAYAMALVVNAIGWRGGYSIFVLVPIAGIVAMAVAIPYGIIALRTRRHQFVILTVALFFVFQLIALNVSWLGGSFGLYLPSAPWPGATYNDRFYYAGLILVALTTALYWWIRRTRFGLQLCAIRDDEDRALSLGVNTGRVKLSAFVISAAPIGMAGALYAYFVGQILPPFAFNPIFDASVAVMCITGGIGTLAGPLIGAAVLESLQQYLTLQFSTTALYLVLYGAVFVLVILFTPEGLYPLVARRFFGPRPKAGVPPMIQSLTAAARRTALARPRAKAERQ